VIPQLFSCQTKPFKEANKGITIRIWLDCASVPCTREETATERGVTSEQVLCRESRACARNSSFWYKNQRWISAAQAECASRRLAALENQTITENYVGRCVATCRAALYGAVEPARRNRRVPPSLDPRRFETLRWNTTKHHPTARWGGNPLWMFSTTSEKWLHNIRNHCASHRRCCASVPIIATTVFFVTYGGSKNYYTLTGPAIRWELQKESRNVVSRVATGGPRKRGDEARPWISGFVRYFGRDELSIYCGTLV
jgi:hypothetical protein